ncbi:MAG: hypothetical protein ACK56I_01970, partial [bacterium]
MQRAGGPGPGTGRTGLGGGGSDRRLGGDGGWRRRLDDLGLGTALGTHQPVDLGDLGLGPTTCFRTCRGLLLRPESAGCGLVGRGLRFGLTANLLLGETGRLGFAALGLRSSLRLLGRERLETLLLATRFLLATGSLGGGLALPLPLALERLLLGTQLGRLLLEQAAVAFLLL